MLVLIDLKLIRYRLASEKLLCVFRLVYLLDMVHDNSCFIGSPFFKINNFCSFYVIVCRQQFLNLKTSSENRLYPVNEKYLIVLFTII